MSDSERLNQACNAFKAALAANAARVPVAPKGATLLVWTGARMPLNGGAR